MRSTGPYTTILCPGSASLVCLAVTVSQRHQGKCINPLPEDPPNTQEQERPELPRTALPKVLAYQNGGNAATGLVIGSEPPGGPPVGSGQRGLSVSQAVCISSLHPA